MTSASPELIALLATRRFVVADLYTFTLFTGQVLRYTTADVNITVGATEWTAEGPLLEKMGERSRARFGIGLDVDTWQIRVLPRPSDPFTGALLPDKIGDVSWLQAARSGALDGAVMEVQRAFLAAWPLPWSRTVTVPATGALTLFSGLVAAVDIDTSSVFISAQDWRQLLTQQMPRLLFSASCRHTLFDAGCTLSADAHAVAGVVGTGSSGNVLRPALPLAGNFALGQIKMTSGPNSGFRRAVRSYDGIAMTLIAPLPYSMTVGETFLAYPGCSKTLARCDEFNNRANFGGQPYIPQPEVAV